MLEINYERYGVPRKIHSKLSQLKFRSSSPQIHTVNLSNGKQLDFYAKLRKSDTLIVSFHGAYSASKPGSYPMFWRISSLQNRGHSFLAFTDPMRLEGSGDILISWFLGKDGWDPMPSILNVIEKAMAKSQAERILFVGGSGGGFVALRASAEFPGSCAFVQDATVGLSRHNPKIVKGYFQKAWSGWDYNKLLRAFPERFNMQIYYMRRAPRNFVYMTQSLEDKAHVEQHFKPFARAHGISSEGGQSRDGSRVLRAYAPERRGHGKITNREFNQFYEDCTTKWLEWEAALNRSPFPKDAKTEPMESALAESTEAAKTEPVEPAKAENLSAEGKVFGVIDGLRYFNRFKTASVYSKFVKVKNAVWKKLQ
ncbi:hypothetical protein ACTXJY_14070 [Corynebacterium casei]|uniref:hypothetical protein n=1 Tax=Corynebacterium casei TaxID=160386 RepID=UPI003FCF9664